MNFTCFIESAQPGGNVEELDHLETENGGERHVFPPLYGWSIADLV